MERLPIFLNIRDKRCVVVGGGPVAARKAELLQRCGAELEIIAEHACDDIQSICDAGKAQLHLESFQEKHIDKACLIIAATDSEETNRLVSELARIQNIPVNVVDHPDLCTFILPAIVDRSPVLVAISSGGSSPVLSRKLKELTETSLPDRISDLANLLASYRSQVKTEIESFDSRLRFWEGILDSEVPELVYSGNSSKANELIKTKLEHSRSDSVGKPLTGEVYLVGAGPGDPDLLTLRALRLMHKADIVLYDRLVSEEIMKKCRPDAEKIYVGKARADHAVEQETINQMLVRLAKDGNRVLRLKGGDPFIFGRGGEELESLAEAGISFQIVPGITAASGCAAYAGIPLTHRDHSQSVRFLTGHTKDGEVPLDWDTLVIEQQTLVFYMGLVGLPVICRELISHGKNESTPIAVIQQGTTRNQKVVTSTLKEIVTEVDSAQLKAPTMIIIGDVVKLRDGLDWYKTES